jgi:hypothetical protein
MFQASSPGGAAMTRTAAERPASPAGRLELRYRRVAAVEEILVEGTQTNAATASL